VNKAASYFRDVGAGDPDDELLDLATCTNFAWQQSSLPSVNPSDRFRPNSSPSSFGKKHSEHIWESASTTRLGRPIRPQASRWAFVFGNAREDSTNLFPEEHGSVQIAVVAFCLGEPRQQA